MIYDTELHAFTFQGTEYRVRSMTAAEADQLMLAEAARDPDRPATTQQLVELRRRLVALAIDDDQVRARIEAEGAQAAGDAMNPHFLSAAFHALAEASALDAVVENQDGEQALEAAAGN